MPAHLRSLSLRARLIMLGGAAMAAALVLALVSLLLMSSFSTATTSNAKRELQVKMSSGAYQSWIYDDDQSNMYAAVIALKNPSERQLADTTWQQAAAAYRDSTSQLNTLAGELHDPGLLTKLHAIQANLVLYNTFSRQLRAAGLAGNPAKAVYIVTVANLTPSNALPIEFSSLHNAIESQETQSSDSVRSSASTGSKVILVVAVIALPLLLLLVLTTIRSIMSGVGHVKERVDSLARAMIENLRPGLAALAEGDFTQRLGQDRARGRRAPRRAGRDHAHDRAHARHDPRVL